MNCISTTNNIDLVWSIRGYSQYAFGSNKILYNIVTGRKIKHTVIDYTSGYYLNGKFVSDKKIKSLLTKIEQIPF